MAKPTLAELFLELAQPDETGFSRCVYVDEFTGRYEQLRLGNGGSWCRDNGSWLGSRYNIQREKQGGAIVYIRLHGYKKLPYRKPIPQSVRDALNDQPCAVLGTAQVEIDHKDGRQDDPRLTDAALVTVEDFQPLSKSVNNAKRQHCKECRDTGQRFDARRLGYRVGQVKGNGKYRGTCVGCYRYDPQAFNREVSKGYR